MTGATTSPPEPLPLSPTSHLPTISIIPSSNPKADAEIFAALFSGEFDVEVVEEKEEVDSPASFSLKDRIENDQTIPTPPRRQARCVVLVERQSGAVGMGMVGTLMFVNNYVAGKFSGEIETRKDQTFMPDATLVVSSREIMSSVSSLRAESDESEDNLSVKNRAFLLYSAFKAVSASEDHFALAMIRLSGGGIVLLVSPAFFSSTGGRLALANFVAGAHSGVLEMDKGKEESSWAVDFINGDASIDDEPFVETDVLLSGPRSPPSESVVDEDTAHVPKFPSLSVSCLNKGEYTSDFYLNSRSGIPVVTDLFVGKVLLILRPPNPQDDPYYNDKIFSKKKRRLMLQIQGRLKYVPTGTIYCGGEVTEQMKLGLVSKGLCSILLNVVKSIGKNMHYSFGDKKSIELPHIVFPAWTSFDALVVTKPGDTPPPMGEEFPESKESVAARKASGSVGEWNMENTYSMSFHSMYVDIPTWRLVNIAVMRDTNLRTFWGESLLRIVVYEKGGSKNEPRHIQDQNKYLVGVQMKFLGVRALEDAGKGNGKPEGEDSLPWDKARTASLRSVPSYSNLVVRELTPDDVDDYDDESDADEALFFDAREAHVGMDVEEEEPDDEDTRSEQVTPDEASPTALPFSVLPPDMLCPGWVEMYTRKGKYAKTFAFAVKNNTSTVFRTISDFGRYIGFDETEQPVDESWSPRMSSSERLRRRMGRKLAQMFHSKSTKQTQLVRAFSNENRALDDKFLRHPSPSRDSNFSCITGFVARALSERHWVEEWAKVTAKHISFYHPDKQKPTFRISLRGILSVSKLSAEESPNFPTYSFLTVETIGRNIYLMFPSNSVRDRWMTALQGFSFPELGGAERDEGLIASVGEHSLSSRGSAADKLTALDDPTEEFLHKSSVWSCKQRRILNCRKFSFSSLGQEGFEAKKPSRHPCVLVEELLRLALEPMDETEDSHLRAFLDTASELKAVSVARLTEVERMAFFINLYHVMAMHAFLVLGTPNSSFKWASYFNMISYQCSDDIFSLTELEHCIIRAAMNYPSQFVAKYVLPKSTFRFALTHADYRINFALNCGSLSNPGVIPVYRNRNIDDQLDNSVRWYLKDTVKVSSSWRGVNVTLPRICQWYAADFGKGRTSDIVRLLEKFLDKEKREILAGCFSEKEQALNVKFLPYNFTCRYLSISEDDTGVASHP